MPNRTGRKTCQSISFPNHNLVTDLEVTVQARGTLDTNFHRFTQIEAIKQALLGTRWKKSVQSVSICVPSFNPLNAYILTSRLSNVQ